MKKIIFSVLVLVGLIPFSHAQNSLPKINHERLNKHLEALAELGKNPKGGVSRIAYTEADKKAREQVIKWMKEAGLETKIDLAGNLVGYTTGKENLKPLVMGSHIDTVPEGGNYDGIVGSLAAIEVIQTMKENKIQTKRPVQVIIFQNEEGGHIGSRAITSGLSDQDLGLISQSKKTVRDGIKYIGGKPDKLSEAKLNKGDIAGYLELHIEQGGILEKEKKQIGIVQGIVGIRRWNVKFEGFANHAGTTPMNMRQDALLAAGKMIDAINKIVNSMPGRQVATAGKINAEPGAPNVIAGVTQLTIETRDLSFKTINEISKKFEIEAKRIAKITNTKVSMEKIYDTAPVPTTTGFQNIIDESAKDLNLKTFMLPSGAGHDAQEMAKIGPMGMIFIPSVKGISHSPEEFTHPEEIKNGTNVLLYSLIKYDQSILN